MESENEKRETVANIVAELRNKQGNMYDCTITTDEEEFHSYADRIEAAWEREREANEDGTLVKSCNTCKHFTLKRKWCRVHDYSPHDPSKLPLIWPNGPCPQWECKYV